MWDKNIIAVGACMAMAWASPAMAATSASARVTGLTFQLIDLDANDGVAASLAWGGVSPLTQVDNYFGQTAQLIPLGDGTTTWTYTFDQLASEFGSATSGFASTASFASGALASTSEEGATAQVSTTLGGQQLASFLYLMGDFTLSANTELRLTGLAESSIAGSGSAYAEVPAGVDSTLGVEFSRAGTFIEVALGGQSFNQTLSGQSFAPNGNPALYPVADYSSSVSSSFSLGWRNTESSEQYGFFSVMAQSSLTQGLQADRNPGPVTPVPEPATWLLLTLGLGGLGAMRAKRREG